MTYINRTLIASKGTKEERLITEQEVISLSRVVVLLGEPGIGKTELTRYLEDSLGSTRVAAGTFWRSADPSIYENADEAPLIVDGLDEIAASGAEPPIDRILHSLSKLKKPNVIISCRSADWTGSVNKHKISQDYGVEPVTVHILPFSEEQARSFLSAYDATIDTDQFLTAISSQGLDDLSGNPLTLRLLAEVWLQDAGLPNTKTELLARATTLLVEEENAAHDSSRQAQISRDELLAAAGAIFAHLLLSGAVGVAIGNRRRPPAGFVPFAELSNIGLTGDVETVTKTRLFKSEAEGQLVPVHRVIAEYLAAQWLNQKLDAKLSQRRLFRLIEFSGGVPSALRGLHAWLGYFSTHVFSRCVDADPYGFLRYGDTSHLSVPNARYLLKALTRLADDDPYFRSEDWGVRAVTGLARPELKQDIVALITSPHRHVQLSALILASLAGSSLTDDVVPELLTLVEDKSAPYVERIHAVEALAKARVTINWHLVTEQLLGHKKHDSSRLATETIAIVGPADFNPAIIADALIALNGINESERREARAAGADFLLISRIPPDLAQFILDYIALRVRAKPRPRYWHPGRGMTSTIERLLSSAIDGPAIEPQRFWSWVEYLEGRTGYNGEATAKIEQYLRSNEKLRREIQRLVLYDTSIDGGPWMAIVHELPHSLAGLNIMTDDAVFFLLEIAEAATPTPYQVALWGDLIRAMGRPDRHDEVLKKAILIGAQGHPDLAVVYEEISRPPIRDYDAEERQRQSRYEKSRLTKFRRHRVRFSKDIKAIAAGQNLGALISLACGYLGRYSDLDRNADPVARLTEWVGEELAGAAVKGFVAALQREDLPDLESVCAVRTENKHWKVESVMLAGVAELVRSGSSLEEVPHKVLAAVLAIWWDMPEFNSTRLGEDIENSLQDFVFSNEQQAEKFISEIIETQLAAGKTNISGVYRFVRERRFLNFSPRLALTWLTNYPKAPYNTQLQLLRFALHAGDRTELLGLLHDRIRDLNGLDEGTQLLWTAVAFCIGSPISCQQIGSDASPPKELIWSIKEIALPGTDEGDRLILPIERYEAIVQAFASEWPDVSYPPGGWSGDQNPWDASDFIKYCIRSIGNEATSEATEALDRLVTSLGHTSYTELLRHMAFVQRRGRRDQDYVPPSIIDLKKILADAEPTSVEDLQAVILDHLDDLQQYVKNSDTGGWEAFWEHNLPKVENVCRDRLLDLLRPRLSGAVELFPELPMPDQNRVDIYATLLGRGLPIEIKGQWHPQVWNASTTQLNEKYARDWRTGGHGIYLVFWFGQVAGKNLPPRPDGAPLPSSPSELQHMLSDGLGEGEKMRIDVVVFDVSMPQSAQSKLRKRMAKAKKAIDRSSPAWVQSPPVTPL